MKVKSIDQAPLVAPPAEDRQGQLVVEVHEIGADRHADPQVGRVEPSRSATSRVPSSSSTSAIGSG